MAQHSPYTPGELAADVPGRESQLAAISERLAYMAGLRRLIGRIRLDQGPRGVGKTSLLAAAQRRAQQLGMLTIWVSAGTENPIIGTLTAEIADATQTWRRRVDGPTGKYLRTDHDGSQRNNLDDLPG